MTTNTLAKLMEQAQVFASAWSLVGGRFDSGNGLEEAEAAKAELCEMIHDALTAKPTTGPLTDHEIETLAHRMCWRYKHSSDPAHSSTYTFNRVTLQEFARKLMQGETE